MDITKKHLSVSYTLQSCAGTRGSVAPSLSLDPVCTNGTWTILAMLSGFYPQRRSVQAPHGAEQEHEARYEAQQAREARHWFPNLTGDGDESSSEDDSDDDNED